MGLPDHLTCLLRNLYVGEDLTVKTRHEQLTCSKLEKEYVNIDPCLFNLYAEYIMRNTGLDEAQTGIKREVSRISDMQIIPSLQQKAKNSTAF